MIALGNHILVEFTGCSPENMNDVALIETAMVDGATKAGATVINSTFHHFSPFGVSGVVVIQESHLAIHTWPEYGYAAVDLFTCGEQVDPWQAFDFLKESFGAKNYSALEMKRGALGLLERLDVNLSSMRSSIENRVSEMYNRNIWFTDKDDSQALSLRYKDVLFKKKSPYQEVRILDTYAYGKTLTIDNMVMTTERDEFHYHEMICHPAAFAHGNIKNVLVIGAGDGGTIRELVKHDSIEKITMVEIDEVVIEACKEYLPTIAAAFDHPKLNLIIGDGIKYVKDAEDSTYDLVLIDGSDPVGPAEGLFSVEFYQHCNRILKDRGILVAQGESPTFNTKVFVELHEVLESIFGEENTAVSLFSVPTYPSGTWSFQWGVKGGISPGLVDAEKIDQFVHEKHLRYYNSDIHQATFALPQDVKSMLHKSKLHTL